MLPKYIVEDVCSFKIDMSLTTHHLSAYLEKDPHPEYRLVSVIKELTYYLLVWELKDI